MASEKTPLIPSGVIPPSEASGNTPTVYFLERRDSNLPTSSNQPASANLTDAEEIETLPEGSTVEEFNPRPVSSTDGRLDNRAGSVRNQGGWLSFFTNVGKKTNAVTGDGSLVLPRKVPVKVDPKVFFANERTFLAWLHVSVILAGASVAIVAFADAHTSYNQLYGVILLPVSIAFILYAMMQCEFSASFIS